MSPLHICLDIETLGTKPGCIITELAFRSFNLDGKRNNKARFHMNISIEDCQANGLLPDPDTLAWWQQEEHKEAYQALLASQKDAFGLAPVMEKAYKILTDLSQQYTLYIWGRGIGSFDLPILDYAMRHVIGPDYRTPWAFWQAMDIRTLYRFMGWCGMERSAQEPPHSAIEDVNIEINQIQSCYKFANKPDKAE